MTGFARGNYLSNLINTDNVKKLNMLIPVTMVDFRFYNYLAKGLQCKPNTGITAIFHILSNNPKQLKIFGFSFMLDGWYKDYRNPDLFDSFNWQTGKKINYEQAVEKGFNSKRHKQKETWEYCKKNLLDNEKVLLDPLLLKILKMNNFSRENYKKLEIFHEKK
jgi:hypothetical protein